MNRDRLPGAVIALYDLVSRLRGPGGCPWDAKQDLSTVKAYLIEEVYEVLDAIDRGPSEEVCQELGDLLFQIIFVAKLAEEKGDFDLLQILERITEKMIRRHPHVFGSKSVTGPEEVAQNWEKIKMLESGTSLKTSSKTSSKAFSSPLQRIPINLPALLRAQRIGERASKANFDWQNVKAVWEKVEEEWEELEEAIEKDDQKRMGQELGDLLFSLVNLARHLGINAELVLGETNQRFIERFSHMEAELNDKGFDLSEVTLKEMDRIWEKIKTQTGD